MSTHPLSAARWTRARTKTLGVVMIVRNEGDNLPHLFRSIADVADEVVVVDTGSTDHTLAVCAEWGVKVVEQAWQNDFSAARNRSIEEASARYLLWLDGDDRVPAPTQEVLRALRDEVLPRGPERAYVLQVSNIDTQGEAIDAFLQTRIFPRRPGVRFINPIHEQITDSLLAEKVEIIRTDWVIHHTGYSSPEVVRAKAARNEALLCAALETEPDNLYHRIHLAQTYIATGRPREADAVISEAIGQAEQLENATPLQAELHTLRATYRTKLGQIVGAAYDLERAIALLPEWGLPYSGLAQIRFEQEDWSTVRELAETGRTKSFGPGIIGFCLQRSQSNLDFLGAKVVLRAGEVEKAVDLLRRSVEVDPRFTAARLELGQLLLEQERFEEAREVLEPLGSDEGAIDSFVDVSTAVGLARAMTGDLAGAGACLAPLLDLYAVELNGADDVSPLELAEVLIRSGHGRAATHLITLFQKTVAAAA